MISFIWNVSHGVIFHGSHNLHDSGMLEMLVESGLITLSLIEESVVIEFVCVR